MVWVVYITLLRCTEEFGPRLLVAVMLGDNLTIEGRIAVHSLEVLPHEEYAKYVVMHNTGS